MSSLSPPKARPSRSTPFEPVEVVGQTRGQLKDSALECLTEQVQLDLGTRGDVLVPRQHDDPAGRNVPLELLHQIFDEMLEGKIKGRMVIQFEG